MALESSRAILLELTGRAHLLEHDPVISHSIELRNPYTDVLNRLQVELLKRYQDAEDHEYWAECCSSASTGWQLPCRALAKRRSSA